jgi:hypothetical protein
MKGRVGSAIPTLGYSGSTCGHGRSPSYCPARAEHNAYETASRISTRASANVAGSRPPRAEDRDLTRGSAFLLGPGFCAGIGNGLVLGYLMYTSGLVPRGAGLGGFVTDGSELRCAA